MMTKKKCIVAAGGMIVLFFVVAVGGFYPVALVDRAPVFFNTWRTAEGAAIKFLNAQARSHGITPADFYALENADLLLTVKRNTLTFLIEDKILEQEGGMVIDTFHSASGQKVVQALGVGGSVERGAELLYGLDSGDFKKLMLLPQARRDVLREAFEERGEDFEEWFREVRKLKNVRLLFVPFEWNGEVVR